MKIEIISSVKAQATSQKRPEKKAETPPDPAHHQIVVEKEKEPLTDQAIAEIIAKLREEMQRSYNRRLEFAVNREIDRVVVKVIDKNTDKVIKEIPPVEIQHMIASIRRSLGLLVDKQI